MTFAEKLIRLKTNKNLTSEKLAKAIGTNLETICKWEKGEAEPSIFQLTALAKFFQVSTDYLLGLEENNATLLKSLPGFITPYVNWENDQEKDIDENLMLELVELTRVVDLKRSKRKNNK